MKKILSLFFVLTLILTLAACGAPKTEQPEPFTGSIDDLIKQNKNLKCVLQFKEGYDISEATTYVSSNKARSDYKMNISGQPQSSHFISDGTWMYTWIEGMENQASKIKIADLEDMSTQAEAEEQGYDNYQERLDYQCYKWSVDQSIFVPPANINFIDFTEMMKTMQQQAEQIQQGGNIDMQSMCSMCDTLTDASAKTQCKQSLNCK
ncbi:MAG: hypothetical protein A2Y82_05390 [Candidatus Buchananbacteria bacterium RBG_13_36_9]|uniref:DUF4412 domain-containing protein n=1 Tax=Candidatus Buchananbacteria bacterium RBG_13_36_9 TaxID=1797530 RepID=A0A1G1XPF7_9BACT|nr:MAG: hypothetical protein A2Y82_05390 [Candidatus Buchananbacteria bacterium RBG_13_36_9]